MPEIPDFNVPYYNKPLSELRQEWWDHLQQPEVRITQAMDSRHKAKGLDHLAHSWGGLGRFLGSQ